MTGKKDLMQIIRSLDPELDPKGYVYCTVAHDSKQLPEESWATILEEEGITLILTKGEADANGLKYEGLWRRITCRVHSSLDAVGLTALISSRLAQQGIPANIVAGYHHDHVFVPETRSEDALHIMENLGYGEGSSGDTCP
jgi:hypothetical protein